MSFDTGRSETMFTVPVTRGSMMKLRPVHCPIVLRTDWMSALTKFTVTFSSPLYEVIPGGALDAEEAAGAWACAKACAAHRTSDAASGARRGNRLRNIVTLWGFRLDLSSIVRRKRGRDPAFRQNSTLRSFEGLLGLDRVRQLD